jgi:hypothetical protein
LVWLSNALNFLVAGYVYQYLTYGQEHWKQLYSLTRNITIIGAMRTTVKHILMKNCRQTTERGEVCSATASPNMNNRCKANRNSGTITATVLGALGTRSLIKKNQQYEPTNTLQPASMDEGSKSS